MKVFWSWQNDFSPNCCRHFIRDALSEAVSAAGQELGLEDAERRMVQKTESLLSGCFTIVVIEHTPKAFTALNWLIG